jgi:hypothetical protein
MRGSSTPPFPLEAFAPLALRARSVAHDGGATVTVFAQATFVLQRGAAMTLDSPAPLPDADVDAARVDASRGAMVVVIGAAATRSTARIRLVRDREPLLDEPVTHATRTAVGPVALQGDEWILLVNVTRDRDVLATKLPSVSARALVAETGARPASFPMVLDALHVDAPEQRVRAVWRLDLPAPSVAAASRLRVAVSLVGSGAAAQPAPPAAALDKTAVWVPGEAPFVPPPAERRGTMELSEEAAAELRPARSMPFARRSKARAAEAVGPVVIPGAPWSPEPAPQVAKAAHPLATTLVEEAPVAVRSPPEAAAVPAPPVEPPCSRRKRSKTADSDLWAKRPASSKRQPAAPPPREQRAPAARSLQKNLYGKFKKG